MRNQARFNKKCCECDNFKSSFYTTGIHKFRETSSGDSISKQYLHFILLAVLLSRLNKTQFISGMRSGLSTIEKEVDTSVKQL